MSSEQTGPSIVLADDSAIVREGLASILERRGFRVVAQESRADTTVGTVRALFERGETVDILVTDVRMPPGMANDGLEAAVSLRGEFPRLGVMVLSQYVSPLYAERLFEQDSGPGGTGYLLKDRVAQVVDFIRALHVVAGGGVVIDPDVTRAMMRTSRSGLGDLTRRELEVLQLMAEGDSNSQIAEKLVLSPAAVSKHIAAIFSKLGLTPDEENRRVRTILAYLSSSRS